MLIYTGVNSTLGQVGRDRVELPEVGKEQALF